MVTWHIKIVKFVQTVLFTGRLFACKQNLGAKIIELVLM